MIYTLEAAALALDPTGHIKASGVRSALRRIGLEPLRISNKHFCSQEMLDLLTCLENARTPGSTLDPAQAVRTSGLSGIETRKSGPDAALTIAKALTKRSRRICERGGCDREPAPGAKFCSETCSRFMAKSTRRLDKTQPA